MHSDIQRARFFTWIGIALSLVVGAGFFWWMSGKYRGQAAQKVNVSKTNIMATLPASTLVGYWTFDGSHVVWGDTTSEIKDVNPGTKHHGDASNLSAPSAVPGRTGQALSFNGTSSVVSLGSVSSSVKTVAFWVKPNTTTESLIDLNGTATINATSGTVSANNFTSPTIYIDGVSPNTSPSVSYRSSSATTYATRTNTTLTAPSGIQNGDLLVIIFDIGAASPPTPTPPAGFSALPNFSSPMAMTSGGFTVNLYAWYKFANNEAGNYTVTHASASSQGYIAAIAGAHTSTPFSPNPTKNTGTGTTTTATGLTTPADNSLVMFVSSDWGSTSNNLTAPSGTTPTFTKRMGSTAQSGILFVADGVLATAGATGNKTVTSNSTSSDPWGGVLISVQPDTASSSPTINTAWHHIAVTTSTGINASAANLGKISSAFFGGAMDDVRFYSGALTTTEVADLFRSTGAGEVSSFGGDGMMTNGLIAHWTLDGDDVMWGSASAEIRDVSGNGNHGDALGSLATTSVTPGKLGQALTFNGTSDAISSVATVDLSATQAVTASFWLYVDSWVDGDVAIRHDDGIASWFALSPSTSAGTCFAGSTELELRGSEAPNVKCYSRPSSGMWHHYVGVFDKSQPNTDEVTFYLDGVRQVSTVGNTVYNNTDSFGNATLYLMTSDNTTDFLAGKVDDVRVYSRALSATEIADLFDLGR